MGADKIYSICDIFRIQNLKLPCYENFNCCALTFNVNSSLKTLLIAVLPKCDLEDGRCCECW